MNAEQYRKFITMYAPRARALSAQSGVPSEQLLAHWGMQALNSPTVPGIPGTDAAPTTASDPSAQTQAAPPDASAASPASLYGIGNTDPQLSAADTNAPNPAAFAQNPAPFGTIPINTDDDIGWLDKYIRKLVDNA